MNAIVALYAILGETIARQDALIAALKKKGVLSGDEIRAELPSEEGLKVFLTELQTRFVGIMREIEESDK
jgi:hypothetical protein